MVGRVSVEEVRGELDRVAHRPAEQLAEPAAGRASAGVEAGLLDPRVGTRAHRQQLPGKPAIGERIVAGNELPRPLQGSGRPVPSRRLADADDPPVRLQLDDGAEEVRPVTPSRVEQGRIGERDGRHPQARDGQGCRSGGRLRRAKPAGRDHVRPQTSGGGPAEPFATVRCHGDEPPSVLRSSNTASVSRRSTVRHQGPSRGGRPWPGAAARRRPNRTLGTHPRRCPGRNSGTKGRSGIARTSCCSKATAGRGLRAAGRALPGES